MKNIDDLRDFWAHMHLDNRLDTIEDLAYENRSKLRRIYLFQTGLLTYLAVMSIYIIYLLEK